MCRATTRFFTVAMFVAMAPLAFAQVYPTKPIRVIVPYPAGGTNDIVARTIGEKLTEAIARSGTRRSA